MRLIDADELIPLIKMGEMNTYDDLGRGRNGGIDYAIERVNQMPTIEERKTGKWIKKDFGLLYCSECDLPSLHPWPYCERCGAKMDF